MKEHEEEFAVKAFTSALRHMLGDTEGIIVEVYGEKYVISNTDGEIQISEFDMDDIIPELNEVECTTEAGTLLWMHDRLKLDNFN